MARGSGLSRARAGCACRIARRCRSADEPDRRSSRCRPLLDSPQVAADRHAGGRAIPFADDPSNRDPRFTRPRLRELMPLLAARRARRRERLAAPGAADRRGPRQAICCAAVNAGAVRAVPRPVAGRTPVVRSMPRPLSICPPKSALRLLGRPWSRSATKGRSSLASSKRSTLRSSGAMPRTWPRTRDSAATLAGAMVTLSGDQTDRRTGAAAPESRKPRKSSAKPGLPSPG